MATRGVLLGAAALLSGWATLSAGEYRFQLGIHRGATSWWMRAEAQGSGLQSVTMWPSSDPSSRQWFIQETPTLFELETDEYASLAQLHSVIRVGEEHDLEFKDPTSLFRFLLVGADPSWFPSVPEFDPIEEPVSFNPTFSWSWQPNGADVKIFEFEQWTRPPYTVLSTGAFWTWRGEPNFDSLTQQITLVPTPSYLTVRILYASLTPGLVTNWALLEGEDVVGENRIFYVLSYDEREVEVIPEPGSAAFVFVGFLALRALRNLRAIRLEPH